MFFSSSIPHVLCLIVLFSLLKCLSNSLVESLSSSFSPLFILPYCPGPFHLFDPRTHNASTCFVPHLTRQNAIIHVVVLMGVLCASCGGPRGRSPSRFIRTGPTSPCNARSPRECSHSLAPFPFPALARMASGTRASHCFALNECFCFFFFL